MGDVRSRRTSRAATFYFTMETVIGRKFSGGTSRGKHVAVENMRKEVGAECRL